MLDNLPNSKLLLDSEEQATELLDSQDLKLNCQYNYNRAAL